MNRQTTLQVLDTIQEYIEEKGFSPSIRDIQERAGIQTTSRVLRHLRALTAEGIIKRTPELARSIVLTGINPPERHNDPGTSEQTQQPLPRPPEETLTHQDEPKR